METRLGFIDQSFDLRYTGWAREALNDLHDCFTITDPCIVGHPIVFASNGLLKMFGYSNEEVVGNNGRMFQGPETDRRSVMEIREAIREERALQISLLNYRKDGTPFYMLFHMFPVFCKEDGRVIHFVGIQVPILGKLRLSELGIERNEISSSRGSGLRGYGFGGCRKESCSDRILEIARLSAFESVSNYDDKEVEFTEPHEANEAQKTKSTATMNSILSVLTHYSELSGRLVSGKRCCISGFGQLDSSSLTLSLGRIKQSFVLTDALSPDLPIVYASEAFLKLTGYATHEVIGQNCRFLSGMNTDPSTQFQIRECIQTYRACTVRILNYRKNMTPFWNFLHISPVRNASGKVAYFVGIQMDDSSTTQETKGLSPHIRQLGVVGAVKVAVRGLSMGASTS